MNKQDSLETRFPAIAKEWDWDNNEGITPSQVSSGSHKKVFGYAQYAKSLILRRYVIGPLQVNVQQKVKNVQFV